MTDKTDGRTVITETLARGIRRDNDRLVALRMETRKEPTVTSRFGPFLRAVDEQVRNVFGPDRCCRLIESKKRWTWFIIDSNGTDCYYLSSYSMWRTSTGIQDKILNLPIALTQHFVERHIQSTRGSNDTLTSIALQGCDALRGFHQVRSMPNGGWRSYWRATGNVWIALPQCLILGDMPEFGDIVLRTLIRAEGLGPAKRKVWEQLRHAECPVGVFRDRERVA